MKRILASVLFCLLLCAPAFSQVTTIYQGGEAYSVLGGSAVFGDDGYLNFNHIAGLGSAGYGIRDNAGTIEAKDEGGAWAALGGSSTSISQGGGSCAVDASGNITCEVPSGGTFTVTDGTTNWIAADTNGKITLLSTVGQDIQIGASVDLLIGTGSGNPRMKSASGFLDIQPTGNVRLVGTSGNAGFKTSSPGSLVSISGNATIGNAYATSAGPTNGLAIEGDLGIGVLSPTLGKLHLDKGTGFGQATLDGSSGGCLMIRDTDDAGWTEIIVLDGTITSTTDADGVCDGS